MPAYTPTLDTSLPTVTYHIYSSGEAVFPTGHIFYFKVKSAADKEGGQTLWVLQAAKRRRYQIGLATLHRSTDFTTPCVQVQIDPVKPERHSSIAILKGRSQTLFCASPRPILERQDRVERDWGYRRFHFAGREFVWETQKNPFTPDTLFEVERSWPKAGSKTGKREHKVVGGRLVWGELRTGFKKTGLIHMVGGLDQAFVEYVLASQLARLAVISYGHD